jgi:hypothetical protein
MQKYRIGFRSRIVVKAIILKVYKEPHGGVSAFNIHFSFMNIDYVESQGCYFFKIYLEIQTQLVSLCIISQLFNLFQS